MGQESRPIMHLELKNVCAGYGPIQVLQNVSLEVRPGETVALIGSNGAGKTTTLRTISGLIRPTSGSIAWKGQALIDIPAHALVTRGIAHVPEGRCIFYNLTVIENIWMGAYRFRKARSVKQNLERVLVLFPRLRERAKQRAGTLSGGEQQMLALARALMSTPDLLMLDEPSMGLAPFMVERIFESIVEIRRSGTSILLVEQDTELALSISNRVYVLQNGAVVRHGAAAELQNDPIIQNAYLASSPHVQTIASRAETM